MMESTQLSWRCGGCGGAMVQPREGQLHCRQCGKRHARRNKVWECAEAYVPPQFGAERSQHLLDIEQRHFWFKARDTLLRNKLSELRRPADRSLLDLGCGSGRLLSANALDFSCSVGVEGHVAALQRAAETCAASVLLHADVLATPLADGQFDWVTAFDVLEHVDPAAFLAEANRLARADGRLLLSVPAFPILWSHVDELAGHRCRYRLRDLRNELGAAGWRLRGHTYYQCLLFPLLAASRWLNRNTQPRLERTPPAPLNRILAGVNHLEVSLFGGVSLPFGSTLIVWADKKPATRTDHD